MAFAKGRQQIAGQPTLVTSDAKGNQVPIVPVADPTVVANPPAAADGTPPAPGGAPVPQPEPKPEPKAETKPNKGAGMAAKPKPQNKPKRKASEDAVLSRARRMFRSEMKKISKALGFEEYDEVTFNSKIEEMTKARDDNLSMSERQTNQLQTIEAEKSKLLGEKQVLQAELTKAKRELASSESTHENFKVEQELRDTARQHGIRDPDYALHLLKKHCNKLPEGEEPDVPTFFEDLKKDATKRHLFEVEDVPAGPKPIVDASQQQQQQQQPQQPQAQPQGAPQAGQPNQPPQAPPKPVAPGGAPAAPNALEMSDKDYREYVKGQYDYTPGMA